MNTIQIFFEDGQPFESKNIKPLVGLTGLYLIYNSEIQIQYPFRKSRLIYVGMSEKKTNSMGRRLQGHFEGISGNEGIVSYQKVNKLLFTYLMGRSELKAIMQCVMSHCQMTSLQN